jgi:hypothetical protein
LELKEDLLLCDKLGPGDLPSVLESNFFVIKDNPGYNAMVDYLSTLKWKAKYINEKILDGTDWGLTMVTDSFTLKSSGSNDYPPEFPEFLKLLNKITMVKGVQIS